MEEVLIVLAVSLVVWLVMTGAIWLLVPVAFGMTMGFWQAAAMAALVMLCGGGVFFLADH